MLYPGGGGEGDGFRNSVAAPFSLPGLLEDWGPIELGRYQDLPSHYVASNSSTRSNGVLLGCLC